MRPNYLPEAGKALAVAIYCGNLVFLGAVATGSAQELLQDGDFELSQPDGTFPSSGFWLAGYLGEAGAIVLSKVGVSGHGLYLYTGASGQDFWTAPSQEYPASPGQVFEGSASIRNPVGSTEWVAGTRARVHVAFLNANSNVLTSFESVPLTTASSNWERFQVTTEAAPVDTAFVRYMCVLEKPRGATNLSIAVFDNCSLRLGTFTGLKCWPAAVGFPLLTTRMELNLVNSGNTSVTWSATNFPSWLAVIPNGGLLAPGNQQQLFLDVNRSLLAGTDCVKAAFQIASDAGITQIRVFVELAALPVPAQPALVRVQERQVVVQDRLPNGQLTEPFNYALKGVAWSPSSRATPDTFEERRTDFAKWYVTDVQLLRELNANTVYTFLDFGTNDAVFRVLDNLYRNGIKALITVDENGTGNTNSIARIVTAYRHHPAILGWVVGNEWNINLYHGRFATEGYRAAALYTEQLARLVKQFDTNHFVASTHGDIYPPEMQELANELSPSVDVWGLNVYRGASFTNLFADWASITTKPMMLTEFGTDAYRTLMLKVSPEGAILSADGAPDQLAQAEWNRRLWREIAGNMSANTLGGVCLGGTVFEWTDEWWKAQGAFGGIVGRQDTLGFYASWNPESHPDSTANEEWWGLVTADRQPKITYRYFQEDFAAVKVNILPNGDQHVLLSWPAHSNSTYAVYYKDGSLMPPNSFTPLVPFTNLFTPSNSILQVIAPKAAASPSRFYRVTAQPR